MTSKRPPKIVNEAVRISLTMGQFAWVDIKDAELGDVTWTAAKRRNTYYAHRKIGPRGQQTMIYLHRAVADRAGMQAGQIDHKDSDGLNCRRMNLRPATHGQNQQNRPKYRNNKSGFKGVSWEKRRRKWQVHITANGIHRCLGRFADKKLAVHAYEEAAKHFHGGFAHKRQNEGSAN